MSKLKLRFTLATILISSLLLSIVMATIILATSLVVKSEIHNEIQTSLSKAEFTDFKDKESFKSIKCMLVAELNGEYYTARLEIYTEEEQRAIVNAMLSAEEKVFFSCIDKTFVYETREKENMTIYAIYDATGELLAINHVWKVTVFAFIAVLLAIAIIAWILSSGTLKPVSDAVQKQKDLIANASHELKTPLTIIETDITLAKSSLDTEHQSIKWLNGIETQTARMNELIREMLELSRLESTVSLNYETVKISELFESMTLELEAGCFEKNIKLTSDIAENIEIYSDTEKVTKLFSILLNNAYKYTPEGGEIKVNMVSKKNYVLFRVTNTGLGIPKDKIGHIFERFYKVDESHTGEGNSFGLGLAIAKSLIDAMNGTIKCESVEGEYTSFKVSLPANSHKQSTTQNQ